MPSMRKEIRRIILAEKQSKDTGINCAFFNILEEIYNRHHSRRLQKFIISASTLKISHINAETLMAHELNPKNYKANPSFSFQEKFLRVASAH